MLPIKILHAHNAHTFDPSISISGHFSHTSLYKDTGKRIVVVVLLTVVKKPDGNLNGHRQWSNQTDVSVYDIENSAVKEE